MTTSTSRRSSSDARALELTAAGFALHVAWSTRADGDFHRLNVGFDELERRRRAFVDLPWTMLDEHHGTSVVVVDAPGAGDGARGDVAVCNVDGAVLGCWVGDCAPIVLLGADGTFATVHAGWRGLAAGVVGVGAAALGAPVVGAVLGPCIGPCCYEFGRDDLEAVAAGVHTTAQAIGGVTRRGTRALDIGAATAAACAALGVELTVVGGCTGCTYDGFSHRVRSDPARHVVAAWRTVAV